MGAAVLCGCLLRCGIRCDAPLEVAAGVCAAGVAVLTSVAVRIPRNTAVSRRVLITATSGVMLAGLLMLTNLMITL